MTQCPQNGSLLWRACGIEKQFLPELVDVITALDQFSSLLGFDELAEEVARGLDHLVFLRKNLHFENHLLQEGLESLASDRTLVYSLALRAERLVCFLAKLTIVLAELEMHTITNDLEFMNSKLIVHVSNLCLLANISFDPLCRHGFLALVINPFVSQLETGTDEICAFQRKLGKPRVRTDHIAQDLHLLLMNCVCAVVDFDVRL